MSSEQFRRVHLYGDRALDRPLVTPVTLDRVLDAAARAVPNRIYLSEIGEDGTRHQSFSETREAVRRLAAGLSGTYGLGPGEVLVVLPGNTIASVNCILAGLATGADVVIVSPRQPSARMEEQVARVAPRLVASEDSEARFDASHFLIGSQPPGLCDLSLKMGGCGEIRLFTTGSTSVSKLVKLSQYNFIVNGTALVRHHRLTGTDVLVTANPLYYANALGFVVIGSLLARARAALIRKFDPFLFSSQARTIGATIANMVPPMLDAVLSGRDPGWPASLRYAVTAAAPLLRSTAERALSKSNLRIVQGYGLTETTNFSLFMPTDLPLSIYKQLMIDRDIPPVGSPLFGCEVELKDGEIVMRGHSVMHGYHENPEATDEAIAGGWFHSGDLGRIEGVAGLEGKQVFSILGRTKNVAKIGAVALSLEEIERVLVGVHGISDAAVEREAGPDGNDRLHLHATATAEPELGALNATLCNLVGGMCRLQSVNLHDAVPRFANGKIDRQSLSALRRRPT